MSAVSTGCGSFPDERVPGIARFWTPAIFTPTKAGKYERLSLFGITVDYFDGKRWRRVNHKIERGLASDSPGVICANQDLPWRAP